MRKYVRWKIQKKEHINITNKTKCRISFFFIYYLPISLSTLLLFSLILLNKLVKCQTTFGNTVQIPVTILLQETSWTVLPPPFPSVPLSPCTIYTSSSLSFAPAAIQKVSYWNRLLHPFWAKVFYGRKRKKSVQTSSQLASSCWSQEKRERGS